MKLGNQLKGELVPWAQGTRNTDLKKKKTESNNLLFARAKIWNQAILLAAILVRPLYAPHL